MPAKGSERDRPGISGRLTGGRNRIGRGDVQRVERETRTFRALDYRYGGGWFHEAIVAQLSWGYAMLEARATETTRARLCRALADLTNLAGWTSFDAGKFGQAHARFDHALTLSRRGGDEALASNVLYRKGRVYLHQGALPDALHTFALGEHAAINAGSRLMRSVLCANQAWTYAKFGDRDLAEAALRKAYDAFEHADVGAAQPWVMFFGETDLRAMAGSVHTDLALHADAGYASAAVTELTDVVNAYDDTMSRSKSFCLTMLATAHLIEGDYERAADVTRQALALARSLNSVRFTDRLRPLRQEARRRDSNVHALEITQHLAVFNIAA